MTRKALIGYPRYILNHVRYNTNPNYCYYAEQLQKSLITYHMRAVVTTYLFCVAGLGVWTAREA